MKKTVTAALVAAAMLSACGGGGGGGGGTRPDAVPVSQDAASGDGATLAPLGQVPASDHHTDFTKASVLTPAGLGSFDTLNATVTPEVFLSNAPSIRVAIPELGIDDVFTAADVVSSVSGFLRVDTASRASDGTRRTVMYTAPDTASTSPYRLQFSSLGVWNTADIATGKITEAVAFSVGTRTVGTDIPTTGTASYLGAMLGVAVEGASQFAVGADASALANFGARSVSYKTQNTVKTDLGTGAVTAAPGYNMTGTLGYPAGTNALTGTVTTADGKTGTATGNFYGPQAAELGLTFKATSATGTLVGGAALKR